MENGKLRVKSAVFLTSAFSNSPKSILDALCNEKQNYQCACVWQSYLCCSSSVKHKAGCLMDDLSETANSCTGEKKLKRWWKVSPYTERMHRNYFPGCISPCCWEYVHIIHPIWEIFEMCVTYKHVRTRSLACRIIEYTLPVCKDKYLDSFTSSFTWF